MVYKTYLTTDISFYHSTSIDRLKPVFPAGPVNTRIDRSFANLAQGPR